MTRWIMEEYGRDDCLIYHKREYPRNKQTAKSKHYLLLKEFGDFYKYYNVD